MSLGEALVPASPMAAWSLLLCFMKIHSHVVSPSPGKCEMHVLNENGAYETEWSLSRSSNSHLSRAIKFELEWVGTGLRAQNEL